MRFLRRFLSASVVLCALFASPRMEAQAYAGHPKLIVIVVIDQFRGDYLERERTRFGAHGFRLFLDHGAWFPDCYLGYANTKTAPGHAVIGAGAYSDGNGIDDNEFWDAARSFTHKVSSVEDERYRLLGASLTASEQATPEAAAKALVGSSPRNLRATTFGDELRLGTQGRARVFGVSLKDRAAILPSGQAANAAYWTDHRTGAFVTSTYYLERLPDWVQHFNASDRARQAAREAGAKEESPRFYEEVGQNSAANRYEIDFAKELIEQERLGQGEVTDLLTLSLSANDIQGHRFGPDSPEQREMTLSLDRDLDGFFTWIDRKIGLKNVWIALTADHGIAPIPTEAAKLGVNAAGLNSLQLYSDLNAALSERFSPGRKLSYLLPNPDLPHITLDRRVFESLGIDRRTAEEAVAELAPGLVARQAAPLSTEPAARRLPPTPQAVAAYSSLQIERGQTPQSEFGRLLGHSVVDHGNWSALLVLAAYQQPRFGSGGGTTHFSPWSYDRHVPLAFYGEAFRPGIYRGRVEPVDLAVTLSSLAGVNLPSAAVGRVLTEALREERGR